MKYQQVILKNGDTQQVTFIEAGRVKAGDSITLKGEDQKKLWKVLEVFSAVDEKDFKDSHHSKSTFGSIQKEFE